MAESDKNKRVSLEGLAAVYDDIKDNVLGKMTFSIDPTDGGLNITYESEEKSNE